MGMKFQLSWPGTRLLGLVFLVGFLQASPAPAAGGNAASWCPSGGDFSPLTPQPARGTLDGGNATGPHECGSGGRYVQYEHNAGTGPQLHVIGIYQGKKGADGRGSVQVRVTRPGSSVLVLSAYSQTTWNVQVAPGAQVERIVVSGYEEQRIHAPEGIPVELQSSKQSRKGLGSPGYDWPAISSARLVNAAEGLVRRKLTSFRGCYEAASFEVGAPGTLEPANPVSTRQKPTLPRGCAQFARESTYCMTLNSGTPTVLGLDSGRTCSGVPLERSAPGDVSSLAWQGSYLYACLRERGLARFSLLGASVDIAPVSCQGVASHRDGLLVMLDDSDGEGFRQALVQFDSLEAAARHESSCSIEHELQASRMAVQGDQGYFAWHSTNEISTLALKRGATPRKIKLKGYNGWIMGLDVTADGRLLILGRGSGANTQLLTFARATGKLLKTQSLPFDANGLVCTKGGL